MFGRQLMVSALGSCVVLALGLAASIWTLGAGVSEAQQDVMRNCPQTGKWTIAVWDGPDGTDTGQALATCGETTVAAAYYIHPEAQGWERWLAGRPELSSLGTLNYMQGVLALGSSGAPSPTATATLTPAVTPTFTPVVTPTQTPRGVPTPVAFQKGDEDLTFHFDAASFELGWMVMGSGWVELTVFRQQDGSVACASERLWAPTSGSKICDSGSGDFRLEVATSGHMEGDICVDCNDWTVSITPR